MARLSPYLEGYQAELGLPSFLPLPVLHGRLGREARHLLRADLVIQQHKAGWVFSQEPGSMQGPLRQMPAI